MWRPYQSASPQCSATQRPLSGTHCRSQPVEHCSSTHPHWKAWKKKTENTSKKRRNYTQKYGLKLLTLIQTGRRPIIAINLLDHMMITTINSRQQTPSINHFPLQAIEADLPDNLKTLEEDMKRKDVKTLEMRLLFQVPAAEEDLNIDAFLLLVASGHNWREGVAERERSKIL